MTPARDEDAPQVFQPPPGNPRFPLFDGVRGIAALGIVVIHTALAVGANIGTFYGPYVVRLEMVLTFFFITSGFLLYRPYMAAKLGAGRAPRLADYARNRFLRIVPAYWLALTALAIYPGLGGFWTDHTWSYYAYLQVVDRGWAFGGILPAWSLSVEMSFYILLPLIAWAMARSARGRTRSEILRREAVLVAVLIGTGLAYRVLIRGVEGDDPQGPEWMFLPAWIAHIALGMGLAVVSVALAGRAEMPRLVRLIERRPGVCWIAMAVLYWVVATRIGLSERYPEPTSTAQWLGIHVLHALVGLAFVAPAVFGDHRTGLPRKILGNRVVVWFGTVSYGVFLYHVTLLYHLKDSALADLWSGAPMLGLTLATLIVSTACACVSYYVVERPLMRLKKTRATDTAPPAPAPPPVAAARAG